MSERSALRIKPFLAALEVVWLEHSHERFGQLVMNLTRNADGTFDDPWNWENSEWLWRIERYRHRATPGDAA